MKPVRTVLRSVAVGVVLMWLFLQLCTAETVVHHHPPVLEGNSVTLLCEGNTSSNQSNRNASWNIITSEGKSTVLCHNKKRKCESINKGKYEVTWSSTHLKFSSSLTIHNVTYEEQNTAFVCSVYNNSLSLTDSKDTWNLSKVFYPPENLTCTSQVQNSGALNMTCVTTKVYPGIVCELVQMYGNGQLAVVNSTYLKYVHTSGDSRYLSASCSALLYLKSPGTYVYKVTVFPGVSVKDRVRSNLIYRETNKVSFSGNPFAVLEQQNSSHCSDVPIKFVCTAYHVSTQPEFQWSVSNASIGVIKVGPTDKSGNRYSSTIELQNLPSYHGKLVQCLVKASPEVVINVSKYVDLIWPPSDPPYITYRGTRVAGNTSTLYAKEKETLDTLACEVKGGNPAVSSVHVMCKSDLNDPLVDEREDGESVNFTIKTNSNGKCQCSAQHESKCYNATATLSFQIVPARSTTYESVHTVFIIYYLVAGTIGVIFLTLMLGVILFLCRRWKHLYSYIYIYASVGSRTDRRTERSDCNKDCEDAHSVSGSSLQRHAWTRESQRRLENADRRSSTPSGSIQPSAPHEDEVIQPETTPLLQYRTDVSRTLSNKSKDTNFFPKDCQPSHNQSPLAFEVRENMLQESPYSTAGNHILSQENIQATESLPLQKPQSSASECSSSVKHYHALPPPPPPPPLPCRLACSQVNDIGPVESDSYFDNFSQTYITSEDLHGQSPSFLHSVESTESEDFFSINSTYSLPLRSCNTETRTDEDGYFAPVTLTSCRRLISTRQSNNGRTSDPQEDAEAPSTYIDDLSQIRQKSPDLSDLYVHLSTDPGSNIPSFQATNAATRDNVYHHLDRGFSPGRRRELSKFTDSFSQETSLRSTSSDSRISKNKSSPDRYKSVPPVQGEQCLHSVDAARLGHHTNTNHGKEKSVRQDASNIKQNPRSVAKPGFMMDRSRRKRYRKSHRKLKGSSGTYSNISHKRPVSGQATPQLTEAACPGNKRTRKSHSKSSEAAHSLSDDDYAQPLPPLPPREPLPHSQLSWHIEPLPV